MTMPSWVVEPPLFDDAEVARNPGTVSTPDSRVAESPARRGRPRLLDLFSCAGGAAVGYWLAGFDVVGVDVVAQPRYPFQHVVADAMAVLRGEVLDLSAFDVIHASPPCQRYLTFTKAAGIAERYPDLLEPVLDELRAAGGVWVVENVPTAPWPGWCEPVTLCGSTFGLGVRRHRRFVSSAPLMGLWCDHDRQGPPIGVYGNAGPKNPGGSGRRYASRAEASAVMGGLDWMTLDEMCEAIPPAYTRYLGMQLLRGIDPTTELRRRAGAFRDVLCGCGAAVPRAATGRAARWCSARCRQRAHRARRHETGRLVDGDA